MHEGIGIDDLLKEIVKSNRAEFSVLQINLYEDKKHFTAEAVFDDEALVIWRDHPAVISDKERSYKAVLREIRPKVKSFYTENRTVLDNIKEFSYGFVDGDLYYVKKRRKVKMTAVFTEEDFKEFNDVKLLAWLSVYTDEDKRKQNNIDAFVLNQLTDEERKRYRRFLAENFDYKKYEQE